MWIVEPSAEDDILRLNPKRVGAIVARLFEQTNDVEMEFIKAEVFGNEGGAPIMAKDHPALQELFKLNAGEQLSPVLCLALLNDSQRCHFYMQTRRVYSKVYKHSPSNKRKARYIYIHIYVARYIYIYIYLAIYHAIYLAIYPDT